MLTFNPQPKLTKKKLKSEKKRLQTKAWKLMSEWVRRKDANFAGTVACFTCGRIVHWKDANAGHFQHGKLDFDPRNIHTQCVQCNLYKSGALDSYTLHLIDLHGIEWVNQLRTDAARHIGYSNDELKAIIQDLTEKLSTLQDNKSVV